MGDEISKAASPPAAEHPKRAVRVPRTLPPLPRSTGRRKKREKKEWTCAWGCGWTVVVGVRVGGWVLTLSQSHGLTKKKHPSAQNKWEDALLDLVLSLVLKTGSLDINTHHSVLSLLQSCCSFEREKLYQSLKLWPSKLQILRQAFIWDWWEFMKKNSGGNVLCTSFFSPIDYMQQHAIPLSVPSFLLGQKVFLKRFLFFKKHHNLNVLSLLSRFLPFVMRCLCTKLFLRHCAAPALNCHFKIWVIHKAQGGSLCKGTLETAVSASPCVLLFTLYIIWSVIWSLFFPQWS